MHLWKCPIQIIKITCNLCFHIPYFSVWDHIVLSKEMQLVFLWHLPQRGLTPITLQSNKAGMFSKGCVCSHCNTGTVHKDSKWWGQLISDQLPPSSFSFWIHPHENINWLPPLLTAGKKWVFNVSEVNKGCAVCLIPITAWYNHDC